MAALLSTPCNGFKIAKATGVVVVDGVLSTPCNGFLRDGAGEEADYGAFNSM